jgi:hypothetical protein
VQWTFFQLEVSVPLKGISVPESEKVRDFIRLIQTVLVSLRRTLEAPFEAQLRQKESEGADLFREILRDLESARLSIAPLRARPLAEIQSGRITYLSALSRELTRMIENPEYERVLRSVRYRRQPDPGTARTGMRIQDIEVSTAHAAISTLIDLIAAFAVPPGSVGAQRDLFKLQAIVPAQKIAPAQFEIKESRLVVRKNASRSNEEDRRNIASAKAELQQTGDKIVRELQQSNCDRRLLDNIQRLQDQLADDTDAIKIGLTNLSCEFMCAAFENELPSAVSSMLKAHTRGVQLFVGQFPEWNKFLENAATSHLETADIAQLQSASAELVDSLKGRPDVVDPEVPRILAYLTQMLENPSASGKRAAFAVLRSVENLISLIFNYGADFVQKTISKTVDSLSTTASRAIVITLLTLALGSATAIGPIASKVPEMHWMQTASEIVKKQLEQMIAGK